MGSTRWSPPGSAAPSGLLPHHSRTRSVISPEFNYESFWRLLDRISISSSSSRLEFQKNEYSTYNRRTHFTPIWYPDGSYTVNTWVIDCWTPAGMLSVNLTDSLSIRGNLWDDWHIAPLDP